MADGGLRWALGLVCQPRRSRRVCKRDGWRRRWLFACLPCLLAVDFRIFLESLLKKVKTPQAPQEPTAVWYLQRNDEEEPMPHTKVAMPFNGYHGPDAQQWGGHA